MPRAALPNTANERLLPAVAMRKHALSISLASLLDLSGQELGVQLLGSTIAIGSILLQKEPIAHNNSKASHRLV